LRAAQQRWFKEEAHAHANFDLAISGTSFSLPRLGNYYPKFDWPFLAYHLPCRQMDLHMIQNHRSRRTRLDSRSLLFFTKANRARRPCLNKCVKRRPPPGLTPLLQKHDCRRRKPCPPDKFSFKTPAPANALLPSRLLQIADQRSLFCAKISGGSRSLSLPPSAPKPTPQRKLGALRLRILPIFGPPPSLAQGRRWRTSPIPFHSASNGPAIHVSPRRGPWVSSRTAPVLPTMFSEEALLTVLRLQWRSFPSKPRKTPPPTEGRLS